MSKVIEGNPWVWVVVMDPGGNEQFVGQEDEENHVPYIPAFLEKEEALKGLDHLIRDEGHQYEVQAIRYEDLAGQAGSKGFMIFILTGAGRVLEKIEP
jgi:hypothetical protein